MTDPVQKRHDEIVALLTEIRDRLPDPPQPRAQVGISTLNPVEVTVSQPDFSAAERRDEPVDVTEEPPVGSQVTDADDDIWQRFRGGWSAWDDVDRYWGAGIAVDCPWEAVRECAPVRFTTDADRERVGLPVDTAPDVDPDEALGEVLWNAFWAGMDIDARWERNDERPDWLRAARAAREHIYEHHDRFKSDITLLERAEKAEADVERLTYERDEAREVAKSHAEDARNSRKRHAALRADVAKFQHKHRAYAGTRELDDALARDDERAKEEQR